MSGPYRFGGVIIIDPATNAPGPGATVSLYDPADTAYATPLSITDAYGISLGTTLTAGAGGWSGDFMHATLTILHAKGGAALDLTQPSTELISGKGILEDSASAVVIAGTAADDAADALGQIADYIAAHPDGGGGAGVSAHDLLTGLGDDDHPQYHTDARADVRYYTRTVMDAVLAQALVTNSATDRNLDNAFGTLDGTLVEGLTPAMIVGLGDLLTGKQDASAYIPYFYELGSGETNPPADFPDGGWVFQAVTP